MSNFEVFRTALRLGLTSFGGPIAHLGYFHEVYVKKKKWISDQDYADLVALCQFLPGPASSQVGMAIGFSRGGIFGAISSWLGFTLPSAIILIFFGLGLEEIDLKNHSSWLHGLKVVAVAVVANTVYAMFKKLCPDKERATLVIVSATVILVFQSFGLQVAVLIFAGLFGAIFLKTEIVLPSGPIHKNSQWLGGFFLILFFGFLVFLPIVTFLVPIQEIILFERFYRAGALVFGGGHVVLPLLQSEVVPSGLVSNDLFMVGYGLANAIPGPLFAFSAYLGVVSSVAPNGVLGGIIALVSAFLPSFLLVVGVIPFWDKLRAIPRIRQAMLGINSAVVGILLAALYDPVWISAISTAKDFALSSVAFLLLEVWKIPSWLVVLITVVLSLVI